MLGLAQEITRNEFDIGCLIRDHEDLRRSSEEIDPDPTKELPLGLGDVGVARAHDHVDRRQRVPQADCHCG